VAILKHEFDHAGQRMENGPNLEVATMNVISIHIDETLDAGQLQALREELADVPHVANVEMNPTIPHELMVEYEEHHNVPVRVLDRLSRRGLHPDIQYC
jgi:hypothetical protein